MSDTNERSVASAGSQRGDAEVLRLRLQAAHDEVETLRAAIRALAVKNGTLSVCNGNVTVTMDGTLTDEEREAITASISVWSQPLASNEQMLGKHAVALRRLLERTK